MDQTDACLVTNDDISEQEIPQNEQLRGESPPSQQFSSLNIQPNINVHGQTENQHSSGRDETDGEPFAVEEQQQSPAPEEPQPQQSSTLDSQPNSAKPRKSGRDETDAEPDPQPQQAEYTKLDAYPMESKDRGCFLIVDLQQDKRSEVDCGRLKQLGCILGFHFIRVKQFQNKEDLDEFLKRLGECDHSDYDCFFVVVLAFKSRDPLHTFTATGFTPGKSNIIKIDSFITPFTASKSPKLKDKPKIVFVYAPDRGNQHQPTDAIDAMIEGNIPNHADFYICVCQPRTPIEAVRKLKDGREDGSHFIWNLCRSFAKFQQKYDICSLMSVVNRETIKNMKNDEEVVKEIYWSRSQLTKSLKFPKVSEKNK